MVHGAARTGKTAASLLGKAIAGQPILIAFDTAFFSVALFFVVTAPAVIALKIVLARLARSESATAKGLASR